MLFCEGCAWHRFCQAFQWGNLKECKDIDYLIIFFASTLKIVNSISHAALPPGRWVLGSWSSSRVLIGIVKGCPYNKGVVRSRCESSSLVPLARRQHGPKPEQSCTASPCPSQLLQRHFRYCQWHFSALGRYAPKIFGIVHCIDLFFFTTLYLFSLFLLCCTQKLAFTSCIAEDVLNFSLLVRFSCC